MAATNNQHILVKNPIYPSTVKVNQVDDYHGVQVCDPYRWLEDDTSPDRAAWIAAQNAISGNYLSQIPVRDELRVRFEQILNHPRYYDLIRRGQYLFFKKNRGLQNQLVLYAQRGFSGEPDVLVDPNILKPDGTVRVTLVTPSGDGQYLAYGLSDGGSEWQQCFIKDMTTRQDLPDVLQWVKLSMIAWRGDGFYYSRYPAPSNAATALSAPNEHHQVWYHRVGTPQLADTLVYADQAHPLRFHVVETTADERFAVLSIIDSGNGCTGNALWVLDSVRGQSDFSPVVTSFDDSYRVVDNEDGRLLVATNHTAPNWRVVLIDPSNAQEKNWEEIIPECDHKLEGVTPTGSKLFVTYRKDATHRLYVLDRSGTFEREIPLPGIGVAHVFQGQQIDAEALWSFNSFTIPPTIYRYDIARGTYSVFRHPEVPFDANDYQTTQVFYPSTDHTRIPMFLVHRKGLKLDGRHPLLLYGYGGNGASVAPAFDPLLLALLERDVVYAAACLRGGGEYGEMWHQAGRRDRKQTVFNDCIAAAEWLQAQGYTNRDRIGLIGASNGGLLVGAVMTQRPDLFKVALPDVGVMDMLRFQKFTVGAGWAAEYGSSDDPTMFPILFAYSPLHNIKKGVRYPATLVTTSEHDDRVVPAHSFKFVATLQATGARSNPYLIRIETRSGHSPVSLPKALDERADVYAFFLSQLPIACTYASRW